MGTDPLVSIVMCVYNAGPYLRPAVESVLSQSYANWELLIVDDGSTDGCLDLLSGIADVRIRRFRLTNGGKPRAMNYALSRAGGSFYAICDADDVSLPRRLERQTDCLIRNPEVAGVFCGYELIIGDRVVAPTFRAKSTRECAEDVIQERLPGHDATAMYRRALVSGVRYSEDLPIVEGIDYVFRVGERLPLVVLGECLLQYRIHGHSVTKRDPGERNRLLQEAYDRMCDRRGQRRQPAPWVKHMRSGSKRSVDNDIVSTFTTSVADQIAVGRRMAALRTGIDSWKTNPSSLYYAKPFFYAMMPSLLARFYRTMKRLARRMAARTRSGGTKVG